MGRLADFLSKRIKISGVEEDVVKYVFFNLLSQAYYFTVCVLCGCILKNMTAALVFYFSFNLLRRYSGGVHASTELRCIILSTTMICVSMLVVKFVPFEILTTRIVLCTISLLTVLVFAPVSAPRKPLSEKRKKINKCKAAAVSVAEIAIALICGNISICAAVTVAMTAETVLLISGYIKNKCLNKNE